ncbi:hypothetical protein AC249_AIPGENE29273 [Exaiptasia diaphana]|nr:hypothetical protein AC249_AIPGENE29273 [Exaiptasia diaphana]
MLDKLLIEDNLAVMAVMSCCMTVHLRLMILRTFKFMATKLLMVIQHNHKGILIALAVQACLAKPRLHVFFLQTKMTLSCRNTTNTTISIMADKFLMSIHHIHHRHLNLVHLVVQAYCTRVELHLVQTDVTLTCHDTTQENITANLFVPIHHINHRGFLVPLVLEPAYCIQVRLPLMYLRPSCDSRLSKSTVGKLSVQNQLQNI